MGRMSFGGAQDLSGLFSSLLQRYQSQVEADVASASRRADEERAAEDREIYAQWKAGKISDKKWLAHLEARVDSSLMPEERAEYSELLLEHRGAIADSAAEANFAMGKIGAGALMAHYRRRMADVEKDSPAWRELATRYGQLSQAGYSAGGGGGGGGGRRSSGGGSGSGGGGGGTMSADQVDAMFEGVLGFDVSGEDIIDPTTVLRGGFEDSDDQIEHWKADIRRIDTIRAQIEGGATTVVDYMTGEKFDVTPEFKRALSNQYISTEQAIAAGLWSKGDEDGAAMALDYAIKWAAGPMTEWISADANAALRQVEQLVFGEMVALSAAADPSARKKGYSRLLANIETFVADYMPEDLETGLRPDQETYDRANALRGILDLGANWDKYSMEERDNLVNELMSTSYSVGEGGAAVSIRTLLTGSAGGGATTDVPEGFVGVLQNADQHMGLRNGEALMSGGELPFPEFSGDFMVYEYDGTVVRAVSADVRDRTMPDGSIRPVLVPVGSTEGVDTVRARARVSGAAATVFASPQPADDPRFRVYRATQSFDGIDSGTLIDSDTLADWGTSRLQALVRTGAVEAESTLNVVQLPGGVTWFQDTETGGWSLLPPVDIQELDPTTGGIIVENGEPQLNPAPFQAQVPAPFAGMTTVEMQGWYNKQVREGVMNPADVKVRGADGQPGAAMGAEFATAYIASGRDTTMQGAMSEREQKYWTDWVQDYGRNPETSRTLSARPTEHNRRLGVAGSPAARQALDAAAEMGVSVGGPSAGNRRNSLAPTVAERPQLAAEMPPGRPGIDPWVKPASKLAPPKPALPPVALMPPPGAKVVGPARPVSSTTASRPTTPKPKPKKKTATPQYRAGAGGTRVL